MKRLSLTNMGFHRRSGMVLILVLVVVMMLSLAVYSFSSQMVTEYTAVTSGLKHIQRRELANSGIDLAASIIRGNGKLRDRTGTDISYSAPLSVRLSNDSFGSIALIRELPVAGQRPAFGLNDESAKLNLNSLPLEMSRRREARQRLMVIPGITVQIADAILDWMDPDDDVSEFGAETSYYTSLSPPRRPGQRRFRDLRELLLVRGITSTLLFGKLENEQPSRNQNGVASGKYVAGVPRPGASRSNKTGWSKWLTVISGESTHMPDGRPKINLNQPLLADLFDQLEPVLGTEAARYIVACRLRGATHLDDLKPDEGADQERRRLERLESVRKRLAAQLGDVENNAGHPLTADKSQRGGLTLSHGSMEFKSLLDLFGGQVQISVNGKDTLLQSPWPSDAVVLRRMLPELERLLTVSGTEFLLGRININQASYDVLRTIPGLSDSVAKAIGRVQSEITSSSRTEEFESVAWLVSRGLLSPAELRSMGSYMTTHGHVQSGIAIGQTGTDHPLAMVEFTIRCSGQHTRLLNHRDLPITSAATIGLPPLLPSTHP